MVVKSILLYLQTILKMKVLVVYIFLFLSFLGANAQINEIGVFIGGSNYIGDIGPTDYIAPNEPTVGLLYKWNRSTRHSYRFSIKHGNIKANDRDSEVPGRQLRGFSFTNSITEFSAGLEFNFFDFDLHESGTLFTPYVSTGINHFIYNEKYILETKAETDYRDSAFAIPMIVGIKTRFLENLILGFEVGARYTFTDNLDGSNPKNDNFDSVRFGNLNSKDWYVFTGFTLTYTFGDNACFCAE